MHIRTNPILNRVLRPILIISQWMGTNHPILFAKIRYFARFHKFLNLKNPKTLNEKMLFMSLCTDTSEWTKLADKYMVREYVKDLGLECILCELYGVWDNASDCDFSKLPNKFVLKCNHGSGDILIVDDKNKLNRDAVIRRFQKELDTPYGAIESGHHYLRIKPKLIAEELLVNDDISEKYSSSLIDYKIWCFNGKPSYIWVCCNRDKNGCDVMTYDLDWNAHPEYSIWMSHYRQGQVTPRPANFEYMLKIAERLANAFPVVSVDLYNLNGKIYFGEMTFTRLGALINFYTPDFLLSCGNMIDISKYQKL